MIRDYSDPEYRKNVSDALKEVWTNESHRELVSAKMKKAWTNPLIRERIIDGLHTEYSLQKIRDRSLELWKTKRDVMQAGIEKAQKSPMRMEKLRIVMATPDYKKKISEASKRFWSDPDNKKMMSKKRKGERNPAWRNGISFLPYCSKFTKEFKDRVREFYNHKCFLCGATPEQTGEKLHVHHGDYDRQACCNDTLPLFVALCRHCHSKTNHGDRKWWTAYFRMSIYQHSGGTMKTFYEKDEMLEILKRKGQGNSAT